MLEQRPRAVDEVDRERRGERRAVYERDAFLQSRLVRREAARLGGRNALAEVVEPLREDRPLGPDVERVRDLIRSRRLR